MSSSSSSKKRRAMIFAVNFCFSKIRSTTRRSERELKTKYADPPAVRCKDTPWRNRLVIRSPSCPPSVAISNHLPVFCFSVVGRYGGLNMIIVKCSSFFKTENKSPCRASIFPLRISLLNDCR